MLLFLLSFIVFFIHHVFPLVLLFFYEIHDSFFILNRLFSVFSLQYTEINRFLLEFICIRLYTENGFTKLLYTNYVLLCLSKHNIIGLTLKIIIL